MSFVARCKFTVGSVKQYRGTTQEDYEAKREASGPVRSEDILMYTQYDENDPEDTKFSVATPSGSMEFQLSNPRLLGRFKPGFTFYVDLTPVS